MKGMNVKVPVKRVIVALEAKLAAFDKEAAEYKVAEAQYDAAKAEWDKSLIERVGSLTPNVTYQNNWRGNSITLTYNLAGDIVSDEPEAPNMPNHLRPHNSDRQEIENALRILRMTDDESVNATTFKAVSQWL